MFKPTTFHIGGDEVISVQIGNKTILILIFKVHLGCWNSSQSILAWLQAEGKGDKEEDFMYLWHNFLTRLVG